MPDRAASDLNVGFGTPFQPQIDYLRNKLNLPTEKWDDIQGRVNDRAFIVAGAAKADLINDLHQSINRAAEEGRGIGVFRKDFKAEVAKHGWTGWTGEGTKAGEAWRTRVIYQTNMAMSHAAGRYQQMTSPMELDLHPYWRYIHSDAVAVPRENHLAWHGLTLLASHPFWKTHFAPNGIGCQCRVTSVGRGEGERSAKAGLSEPPQGWDTLDPKTGAPVGIGKGFNYAPGASVGASMQSFVDAKLINLKAPIGAQMWAVLKPVLLEERLAAWRTLFDTTRQTMQAGGVAEMVYTVVPQTVAALAERGVVLENAAVWMRDTELLHALRDSKAARGAALPDGVWRDLPQELEKATVYLDTQDQRLIYVLDVGGSLGKVAVAINFNEKGQFDGVRAKIVSNFVRTGGTLEAGDLKASRYQLLK